MQYKYDSETTTVTELKMTQIQHAYPECNFRRIIRIFCDALLRGAVKFKKKKKWYCRYPSCYFCNPVYSRVLEFNSWTSGPFLV